MGTVGWTAQGLLELAWSEADGDFAAGVEAGTEDWTCTGAPRWSGVPGTITRYRFTSRPSPRTIWRMGPAVLTMAEPAGLVMKTERGSRVPLPSALLARAST